ncbi:helicase-exonuclease AddAB subunit AddA [Litchfieldia salsa]|uniref:ATP-dependent helicase/nuclease subunit A n=1 Tax=Litchfieldia salsa TaxID=930152 RepID=A0A1H0UN84_9BACI|nr:helicase-exonuclease AddAB subunit AddA [Litchfieldia salsa]SDP67543.1 DNA helicase/exodeoxyribonuclease V, subunit A [Litchfieldia salsa]
MNKIIAKPTTSKWTDDQWKAIVANGQDILVAAAAGSGKTAVLVERIIKKVTSNEHPVDVDRLLVVTFTNASAAEMRNRIGEALEQTLKEQPESSHLRKQLSLLNQASISTLHSFCLNVIRKYYYLIDLDPGFRIANDTEGELLRDEVMESLLEEQYSNQENEAFFDLVDRYSNDRNDIELQNMIRRLYEFSRSNPSPSHWLDEIVNLYNVEGKELEETAFISYIMDDISLSFESAKEGLERALELTKQPGGPAPRAVTIETDLEQLYRLIKAKNVSWQALYDEMQTVTFKTAKPCKGDEYDALLLKNVSSLRDDAKNLVKKLKEELFDRKPEGYLNDLIEMKPSIEMLISLVKEFENKFQLAKQEKGLVDFSDLEHYCLSILRQPSINDELNDELKPSEAAREYRAHFEEVLVDEYQDTNMVQESILQLVSKEEEESGNLFMVGDVKQSIYRFRLAEPLLFLSKYKRFTKDGSSSGLRIDLSKNFRSRAEVLDSTNFLFKQIMGETVGEIDYDDDAELKLGADYPASDAMSAELFLIDRMGSDVESDYNEESEEGLAIFEQAELETAQLEARAIAKEIKSMISANFQVYDRSIERTRNLMYRDIVILLRSMPWAPQMMEEFKQQGIPVYANLSTGYFEATEVAIMMSLLKVIDNPYQDIPLASVLRSPIVGLDANELAAIRIQEKSGYFYGALKSFVKNQPVTDQTAHKVQLFLKQLTEWRKHARQGGLSDLIWQLYRETYFYDFVGGMPGGKQRQANLRALYDRARQYESTAFRGLFRFLRFIERMQERGDDLGTARALGEQEDVVRMMTIHSSKGLEFPVVFVGGLSKQFNMMDLNKKYLLDKELGLGSKYVNPTRRITYPTLPMQAIKKKMKLELIAEEMRVLYVALTRAKEKLILIGTVKDFDKKVEKWKEELSNQNWLLSDGRRASAKNYLDWIGPALIRHRDGTLLRGEQEVSNIPEELMNHPAKWSVQRIQAEDLHTLSNEEQKVNEPILCAIEAGEEVEIESEYKAKIDHQLKWSYDYLPAANHRSKQSVSEIKRQRDRLDEYSDVTFQRKFKTPLVDRPRFMQKTSLTPAEVGTAMHMVMQHVDLKREITQDTIQEQVAKMINNELLTWEQGEVIDYDHVVAFFRSEIGLRMIHASEVRREVPFSMGIPAKDAYADWEHDQNENVLIQGVIDCIFEDEAGIVLVDYKTDQITNRFKNFEQAKPVLEERYKVQLELYTKAIEAIWRKPLTEKYLYFFDGGSMLKM